MRRHASRRLSVVLGVALLITGCGDDAADDATSPTESTTTTRRPTTTTTDPGEALEAEVTAAYEESSRAFIHAAAIPDPNFPTLEATHTGSMLEQRRSVLRALQAEGRVLRYPSNSRYRIEVDDDTFETESDVATFEICGVDDGERVVAATGDAVAGGVGTVHVRVAMRRVDGVWKLAERQQIAEWEGVAGCAAGW